MATDSVQIRDLAKIQFEALLSGNEVDEIERVAQRWGRNRRLVLAVLMHSKRDMLHNFAEADDDPNKGFDSMMELVQHVRDYKEHLSGLQEQAECAEARLLAALSALAEGEAS